MISSVAKKREGAYIDDSQSRQRRREMIAMMYTDTFCCCCSEIARNLPEDGIVLN